MPRVRRVVAFVSTTLGVCLAAAGAGAARARLAARRTGAPRRRGERDDRARGPRLVQLQRLRGEHPAPLPGGPRGRGAPRVLRLGPLRRPQRQPRGTPGVRPLPPAAAVGGPRARPAGGPRAAGLRRLRAASLRLRQPAPQPAARLPVPDEPARGRRSLPVGGARGPARRRVAGAVPGRLDRGRAGPASRERRAVGRGRAASARSRAPVARGGRHPGDALLPAGERRQRRQAGLSPPRLDTFARARGGGLGRRGRVPGPRGAGGPPGLRAGHLPTGGGGPRPPVVPRVLDRARGGRVEPVEPARARRHPDRGAASRPGRFRGGAVQAAARSPRWRPGSSGWGSRRSRARWARGRGTRR